MKGLLIAVMVTVIAGYSSVAFAGDAANGKTVFEDRKVGGCKTCHKTTAKKLVGPGLKGVSARHSDGWMKKWIKDPQAVWVENDAETQELRKRMKKEKKKKTSMKKKKLTDEQVDDLIAYLRTL